MDSHCGVEEAEGQRRRSVWTEREGESAGREGDDVAGSLEGAVRLGGSGELAKPEIFTVQTYPRQASTQSRRPTIEEAPRAV